MYDLPFQDLKNVRDLSGVLLNGGVDLVLKDPSCDMRRELSRPVADYDRFTKSDMGNVDSLCGDI